MKIHKSHFSARRSHSSISLLLIALLFLLGGCRATFEKASLNRAMNSGNLSELKAKVTKENVNSSLFGTGYSALFDAIALNRLDMVEFLVSMGADVNQIYVEDETSLTPLIFAITLNNNEMLDFLINQNANVNQFNAFGQTAAFYSVYAPNVSDNERELLLSKLISAGANLDSMGPGQLDFLGSAVSTGNLPFVKKAVEKGVDINKRYPAMKTPLLIACSSNQNAIAQYLLGAGADIDAVSTSLDSCLHFAVSANNLELAKILIERGAKLDSQNLWGLTPKSLAANSPEISTLFTSNNMDKLKDEGKGE